MSKAPIRKTPTRTAPAPGARLHPTRALARKLDPAGARRLMWTALREIAAAGCGLDLWFHRFEFDGRPLALACRWVVPALRLEIEVDECAPGLPRVTLLAPAKPGRGVRGLGR